MLNRVNKNKSLAMFLELIRALEGKTKFKKEYLIELENGKKIKLELVEYEEEIENGPHLKIV